MLFYVCTPKRDNEKGLLTNLNICFLRKTRPFYLKGGSGPLQEEEVGVAGCFFPTAGTATHRVASRRSSSCMTRNEGSSAMLVLSRKLGEKIVIDNDIVVTVVKLDRNQIRLGIEAPDNVRILREEIAPPRPLDPRTDPPTPHLPHVERRQEKKRS